MECGGNQVWFGFMAEYKLDAMPIEQKYSQSCTFYYKRRLARIAMGQPIIEDAPARNVMEMASKGVDKVNNFMNKLFK